MSFFPQSKGVETEGSLLQPIEGSNVKDFPSVVNKAYVLPAQVMARGLEQGSEGMESPRIGLGVCGMGTDPKLTAPRPRS